MTLGIQGSTVGYDMNGMQQLINDVYTNCVIPASQSMRTNAQNTRYAIDQVWVGASAESFKTKLSNDTETLCKTLEDVAEAIRNDMNNAGSNVEEYDDEIARALFASSGGGSTGTPQTAGTPNAGGAVNPTTGVTDVVNPPSQTPTNPAPDAQGIEGDGNPGATPADPGQTPAPASETEGNPVSPQTGDEEGTSTEGEQGQGESTEGGEQTSEQKSEEEARAEEEARQQEEAAKAEEEAEAKAKAELEQREAQEKAEQERIEAEARAAEEREAAEQARIEQERRDAEAKAAEEAAQQQGEVATPTTPTDMPSESGLPNDYKVPEGYDTTNCPKNPEAISSDDKWAPEFVEKANNLDPTIEGYFQKAAELTGVDVNLLKALSFREGGLSDARREGSSYGGYMGISLSDRWGTGESMGLSNTTDPFNNILAGAGTLASNLNKYDGDLTAALMAYNMGGGDYHAGLSNPTDKWNSCKNHYAGRIINYYNALNASNGQ